VLDAGAFVAVERGDRDVVALIKRERLAGRAPVSHGGVVAQVWRGGTGRQVPVARLLAGVDVAALDDGLGRRAGMLLARSGSLAGRPVALVSSGEGLELPFVHAGQPILAVGGRWADPRVTGIMGVTQGVHVRPILVDPGV
jgi:hypothetical protein